MLGGRTKDSELSNIEGAAAVSEDDICDAKKAYLRLLNWGDQQRIDEASKFVDLVSDSDPEDPAYINLPTSPKKRRRLKNNNIKATKTTALAMNLSSPSKAKLTKTRSYRIWKHLRVIMWTRTEVYWLIITRLVIWR